MSSKNNEKNLQHYRQKIDAIDSQILELINNRLEFVKKIGKIKDNGNGVFYIPSREQELLSRLIHQNKGLLSDIAIKAIYSEIMSASLALEHELVIAYFGEEGSNTHSAAVRRFGHSVCYRALGMIQDIFNKVSEGCFDYGVVPIENSSEGSISSTMDMFLETDLKICSEVFLPIDHHFLVQNLEDSIQTIYSHEQVFGQCRNWIYEHYPQASLVAVKNTVFAVKKASENAHSAAIASDVALKIYPLQKKYSHIQDYIHNTTRFFVIGRQKTLPTGCDKTSILFSLEDFSGILANILNIFKKYSLNLTTIQSRPIKKKIWKYYFYIDFDGHCQDDSVCQFLREFEKNTLFFKILGSYPKDIIPCLKK